MNVNEIERLQEQAVNLYDLIEDISEQYCDDNLVSGEQFYVMLRALVDCKLKEFPFDFDTFDNDVYFFNIGDIFAYLSLNFLLKSLDISHL